MGRLAVEGAARLLKSEPVPADQIVPIGLVTKGGTG
jgi:hypothetical protein